VAQKSKAERFEVVQRRVRASARWRDEMGYDSLWRRMNDLYRGKHWPRTTASREDMISVNLAFSTVNVIAPSVSVNHPKVVVSATKPEDEDRAAFVEAVVNYLWRHHDFKKPFRRAVKDFWEDLFGEAVVETDMFAAERPDLASGLPTDEEIEASIPATAMAVVEDQPFVERISPFDMYVDPEATCMEDAKWVAQRITRRLEDAKTDKRYKASSRRRLTADSAMFPMYDSTERQEREEFLREEDRVVIYEFYDVVDNTMSVFSMTGEDFLVEPIPMPYASGQPFVMLRNYDVPDHFYPMGDLESIESLQLELDKTRSQMMNARKRYARKYLYHERSFGPEGREALESDQDGRLVPVVDENKPLSEVVVPMPQTPLSPEIYNMSEIVEGDISTVSGVSEYARGQMPEIRRTATEASIIADAGNARAADKLAIIEIGISHIARRVLQLMQQFMTGEAMARVTAGSGENLFVNYSRDDITGEYDFSVEGGSTQPINDTIRKQFIMQQAPQAPVSGGEQPSAPQAGQGIPEPGGPPDMGAFAPTGGVPPELLAQLRGQMGMELPSL